MIPTTNGVRPVNLSVMKVVLDMIPAVNDVWRLGKVRDIYTFTTFRIQSIVILLRNGMIVDAAASLPMNLLLDGSQT
jgi:hypothetical protein